MGDLTPIESLQRLIADELPSARVHLDPPHTPTGSWFLDLQWQGAIAMIEWRPGRGFGVGTDDTAYGEGPAIVTGDAQSAAAAAITYLRSRQNSRDALVLTNQKILSAELKGSLLDANLIADMATPSEALTRLHDHAYLSVIVDMRDDVPDAVFQELTALTRRVNTLTIAIFAQGQEIAETSNWAQIVVREVLAPRAFALMIRSLLGYGEKLFGWTELHTGENPKSRF